MFYWPYSIKLSFQGCQINLIKQGWCRWMIGLLCLEKICCPSLIYCDQRLLIFFGCHITLLTRCKICLILGLFANYLFSKINY